MFKIENNPSSSFCGIFLKHECPPPNQRLYVIPTPPDINKSLYVFNFLNFNFLL